MAQSLGNSDIKQERKKEALMQALEYQDKLLSGFGPMPRDNPVETKIVTMAKIIEREKKERDKREKRERRRWKMMMDEMLKWSIMLNSGGKFDASLFNMGYSNFAGNQGIDMSQFQIPAGMNMGMGINMGMGMMGNDNQIGGGGFGGQNRAQDP